MISASGIGFFDARKSRRLTAPGFGSQTVKTTAGHKKELPQGSDSQLDDAVLNALLDEFKRHEVAQVDAGKPHQANAAVAPVKLTFEECIQQTLTRLREHWVEPSQEVPQGLKARKMEVASQLAEWMGKTLEQDGDQVAVVSRQGGVDHKKYDKTGMMHSGIAMYHPREKRWKIYNLLDNSQAGQPRCDVQWTEPVDFFAQQGGYHKDALLMIPDKATQQRMHKALLNGDYRKLLFTQDYNLVSAPDSETSLNCNKWILLNLLAAQRETYEPKKLLEEIRRNFQPGRIDVNPVIRVFAAQRPNVKASEVPWVAPIYTVTVNSLLQSGLFEKARFCAPPEPET